MKVAPVKGVLEIVPVYCVVEPERFAAAVSGKTIGDATPAVFARVSVVLVEDTQSKVPLSCASAKPVTVTDSAGGDDTDPSPKQLVLPPVIVPV